MVSRTSPTLALGVDAWCSWEPGEQHSVCTHYRGGEVQRAEFTAPPLDFVPPMQRRRLSPLARTAFHVLARCVSPAQQQPLVFSSVMGEICRTQGILDSIAVGDPVSPAAFSLSVHNSIAGLWSMVSQNRAPMLSLAPVDGSLVPALIEAAGILSEGRYQSVLVVYCEEEYPGFYQPFMRSPAGCVATALSLVPAGMQGAGLAIQLQQQCDSAESRAVDTSGFSLNDLLQERVRCLSAVDAQSVWQVVAA